MTRAATTCVLAVVVLIGITERPVRATVPSETLLPATTKAFISTPDLAKAKAQWNLTDLGRLVNDPVMQPFIQDLEKQLEGKRDESGIRLGVTAEELEAVAGGEVTWAVIQPGNDKRAHARVVVADVTGHRREAEQLLLKIGRNLVAQGAVRSDARVGTMQIVGYKLPPRRGKLEARALYHLLHEDLLVTSDHEEEMRALIGRMAVAAEDSLSGVRAFQQAMLRSKVAMGTQETHIRWFVEPFGYLEVSRVMRGEEKRRGTDLLQVLQNQGFDAIEGVGGLIALKTDKHELLHKSLIYAPGRPGGETRFELAARMLQFPNGPTVAPPAWVPEGVANLLSWNWKMQDAFEYSKTMVNELAGAKAGEDLFEDIIGSIRDDVAGPRVDLRKELVAFLGERAMVMTDYRLPISPQSERLMVAVDLNDSAKVTETVKRIMESDPDALPRQVVTADGKQHVVWEIINEQPEEVEEIKIVGAGFGPFGQPEPVEEEEEEEEPILPNMAVTVAYDHLLVASHVDFVADLLKQANPSESLAAARDYQRISQVLDELGGRNASFRFFTRTDEAYRPTYELIRQGRMPEAETLTGKLLNRLFGPNEKGVVRQQEIDGSKMPPYEQVKSYLGPAGIFITSENDGWFMTGCLQKAGVN